MRLTAATDGERLSSARRCGIGRNGHVANEARHLQHIHLPGCRAFSIPILGIPERNTRLGGKLKSPKRGENRTSSWVTSQLSCISDCWFSLRCYPVWMCSPIGCVWRLCPIMRHGQPFMAQFMLSNDVGLDSGRLLKGNLCESKESSYGLADIQSVAARALGAVISSFPALRWRQKLPWANAVELFAGGVDL